MQDMRDCYDSLLSAAAAATNSAYGMLFVKKLNERSINYPKILSFLCFCWIIELLNEILKFSEFSESLREMGVCLLQKIALNDDEESGELYTSCIIY